jgi:formylglycine-generating enzyme required for sulfatase activity
MTKNHAVAIGINRYIPNNFTSLNYAKHDAKAMHNFFVHEAQFDEVKLFTDDSPNLSDSYPSSGILKNFLHDRFEESFLEPEDRYWFFFAGHGVRDRGKDYIMPIDANPRNVKASGIEVNYIRQRLTQCGADNVILVIDACRKDGARDGMGIGVEDQPGVITIYSCSPNETSWEIEDLKQGAFTYVLLEALRSQGEKNYATPLLLSKYLRSRVPALCKKHGKVPEQSPIIAADPIEKYDVILIPQLFQLIDIDILRMKNDIYRLAFCEKNLDRAVQIWTRVNSATKGSDPEVMSLLQSITREQQRHHQELKASQNLEKLNHQLAELQQQTESLRSQLQENEDSHRSVLEQAQLSAAAELQKQTELQRLLTEKRQQQEIFVNQLQEKEALWEQERQQWIEKEKTLQSLVKQDLLFSFEVVSVNNLGDIVQCEPKQARYLTENLPQDVTLNMVYVPGGNFLMGSPDGEGYDTEKPQHHVTVPDFLIGKYPITQAQWRAIATLPQVQQEIKLDPSFFKGDHLPIENVSWHDAIEFCDRLSQFSGQTYRLPSEAEWEYACRAKTTTPFYFGNIITTDLANYDGNQAYRGVSNGKSREETIHVGSFYPNAFGLYDTHGNVWEWCADNWHDNYVGAPADGSTWTTNSNINVLRGGYWGGDSNNCRSAYRDHARSIEIYDRIGFRVVCDK